MKITLKRGNDRNLNVTVTKDGSAVNITGWSIRFTVKKNATDTDAQAIINKLITSHTDATNGVTQIPINASDTETRDVGNYYFDVMVKDASDKVHSSNTGTFAIVQEITDEV